MTNVTYQMMLRKGDDDKQDANRKRTDTGWPPGSIGDLSVRVGYDVRDLKMAGYEWDEIQEVADGKITLAELWRRGRASADRRMIKKHPGFVETWNAILDSSLLIASTTASLVMPSFCRWFGKAPKPVRSMPIIVP